MRISDWSSDVCSSDLNQDGHQSAIYRGSRETRSPAGRAGVLGESADQARFGRFALRKPAVGSAVQRFPSSTSTDRKSVVKGKSVSSRVDLGGRRIIIKKSVEYTNVYSLCSTRTTT